MTSIERRTAGAASWVANNAMLFCARVIALPSRRIWLLPVTVLLLPVVLFVLLLGAVAYPVAMALGVSSWRKEGTYAEPSEAGLRLSSATAGQRLLPWPDLLQISTISARPFEIYRAVLASGEQVRIDFVDELDALKAACDEHGVPFNKESLPIGGGS